MKPELTTKTQIARKKLLQGRFSYKGFKKFILYCGGVTYKICVSNVLSKSKSFLVNEFIYTGHLQSLGAAGITLISSYLLGFHLDLLIFVNIYLLFQTIYYFDRYKDLYKDKSTNVERSIHISSYYRYIPYIIILFVVLMAVINISHGNIYSLSFTAGVLILGILYPLYFKNLTKVIPFFKNIYVSLVFALIVFVPVIYRLSLPSVGLVLFMCFLVFGETIITQFILDLKDVDTDKMRAYKTLPVILGEQNERVFVKILSVGMFTFISLYTVYRGIDVFILYLTFLNLILNLFVLKLLKSNKRTGIIIASAKHFIWLLFFIVFKMVI